MLMNAGATTLNGRHLVDQTLMAIQEMERYCSAHPHSPAAIRHPRLSIRGRTFVALLVPNIEEGIAGFGNNRPGGIARVRPAIFALSYTGRQGVTSESLRPYTCHGGWKLGAEAKIVVEFIVA
jgi:hypothetical protein